MKRYDAPDDRPCFSAFGTCLAGGMVRPGEHRDSANQLRFIIMVVVKLEFVRPIECMLWESNEYDEDAEASDCLEVLWYFVL